MNTSNRQVVMLLFVLITALVGTGAIHDAAAEPITSPSGNQTPESFSAGCLAMGPGAQVIEVEGPDGSIAESSCSNRGELLAECDWTSGVCTDFLREAPTPAISAPIGGVLQDPDEPSGVLQDPDEQTAAPTIPPKRTSAPKTATDAAAPTSAHAQGAPLDLPCVTGVTVEILGQAMPATGNGQALVAARLTIEPGGGFDAHTHPGTLTVYVDSGSLGLTLLEDAEMTVNRAPVNGKPGVIDPIVPNEEILLNVGDWVVEDPMVHQAFNRSDEPTVVILSGLVDPAQPLVVCGDAGMVGM